VSDQPGYPISAQGFENSVDATQSPGVIVQLDGASNGAQIRDSPEAMAFLHGTDNAVRLIGNAGVLALAARDDTVTVRGTHNTVSLVGATPGTIVTDRGLATTIVVDSTELTIQDFRAAPWARWTCTNSASPPRMPWRRSGPTVTVAPYFRSRTTAPYQASPPPHSTSWASGTSDSSTLPERITRRLSERRLVAPGVVMDAASARAWCCALGYACVLVWCKACRHESDADLQALVDAGRGDVPLIRLRFRCSNCGGRLTDWVGSGEERGAAREARCRQRLRGVDGS
jgi:hypothetical protein